MTYRVELRPAALRDLARVENPWRLKIARKIDALAANPRPPGVEKLAGSDNRYRVRSGDYRIVYEIHDRVLLILVVRIGHRREVYR
ncbi:type II toxin-antitoxin system RelE family toxin [Desulfobacca acetoxidans]|uniref:Addiction module toxin, RelE/StbE family n=1 Tax=Desulfobacca acetoxidans (strain ATCC 700848 / DSM 11109 / ASRB2) TaxID=880072 RepID=F2NCX0_DESAR|nr:type II toxin-antitoxin system RelE/ParE family toxin [Desulfobacca acetoxidans]AEB09544.1 addiction module toxin, RelE/StbE family [Desulfobacca acetoxidans DSM 11109]